MERSKILYQIKSLENMIARKFIKDDEFCKQKLENKKMTKPTSTQMQIMGYILEHIDEVVYQKDLEEVLNLRRATVSGVLQTMEKNNLIKRVTDTIDTRTKKIILNEKAKESFLKGQKKIIELEKVAIEGVTEEELKIFINVIEKMKNNIIKERKILC